MSDLRGRLRGRRAVLRQKALDYGARVWLRSGSRLVARLFHHSLIFKTANFATVRWAGVLTWQSVLDLWTIQETISEVRPGLLIEIGTHKGGSALFYANVMDALGHGHIITIDIADLNEIDHPRVTFVQGSSTAPEVVEQVRVAAEKADGPVMVILDGDHSRANVARELELYAPLVTPGSYLLSQDGVDDQFWYFRNSRPGPLGANRAFLESHHEFEHDRERNERYLLTQHPVGWIRRRPR